MTKNKSPDYFENNLKQLITAVWDNQVKILELKEFDRQWTAIFEQLEPSAPSTIKINVGNTRLFQTFRFDKFHIICADLLSMIENELSDEYSVIRNSQSHIVLKSLQSLINEEQHKEVRVVDLSGSDVSIIDSEIPIIHKIVAQERLKAYNYAYRELFGSLPKDMDKSPAIRSQFLKDQILTLRDEVRGIRNLFSHRHQIQIQKRWADSISDLEITKIDLWNVRFFKIIQNIALLHLDANYAPMDTNFKDEISDQIDIILFGSINRAIQRFKEANCPGTYYWELRKQYFESPALKTIIYKEEKG